MKALVNLPKTLEETYDRVFLAITEEERLFFQYALKWILYHNELYDRKSNLYAILLQAVAKCTARLISSQDERFYGNDTFQELCGCLISVILERTHTIGDEDYSTLMVSFAHYAVREYIDSVRISGASAAYFIPYPENL